MINTQQRELARVEEQLQISSDKQQNLIIDILKGRFGNLPPSISDRLKSIHDLDHLNQLLQQAIAS